MHGDEPAFLLLLVIILGVGVIAACSGVVLIFASSRITGIERRSFKRSTGVAVLSFFAAVIVTFACHDVFLTWVSVAAGLAAAAVVMTVLNVVVFKVTLLKAVEMTLVAYFLIGIAVAAFAAIWAMDWPR